MKRYVNDKEMANLLKKTNPEAFRNIVREFLEANGRGLWNATADQIAALQEAYAEAEDLIERMS